MGSIQETVVWLELYCPRIMTLKFNLLKKTVLLSISLPNDRFVGRRNAANTKNSPDNTTRSFRVRNFWSHSGFAKWNRLGNQFLYASDEDKDCVPVYIQAAFLAYSRFPAAKTKSSKLK